MNRFALISFLLLFFYCVSGQRVYTGTRDTDMLDNEIVFEIDTLGLVKIVLVDNNGFINPPSAYLNAICFNKMDALVSLDSLPICISIKDKVIEVADFNYANLTLKVNVVAHPSKSVKSIKILTNISDLKDNDHKLIQSIIDTSKMKYTILGTIWYKSTEEELQDFLNIAKYSSELNSNIILFCTGGAFNADLTSKLSKNGYKYYNFSKGLETELLINFWPSFNLINNSSGEILLQNSLEKIFEYIKKLEQHAK